MSVTISLAVGTLVAGSLYALVASGLSLVWGTLRIFNFAAGALMMVAAYGAYYLMYQSPIRLGYAPTVIVSIIGLGVVGIAFYWLIVQPYVRRKNIELVTIITTLAAATLLENGSQQLFGANYLHLPVVHAGSIPIASTGISWQEIAIVIAGPAILAGLVVFLKRAKIGLAIRSVAHNQDAALLVGIDVDRTYAITFGLGAMLAAVAGLLYGGEYYVLPTMGEDPLLRAFVVVVLGGLGSLGGTFVAAYAVGAVETVSQYFVGPFWSPVVLFAVLVLALLFRPAGLFGSSEQ